MSIFSSLIKPILEQELRDLEPQLVEIVLNMAKRLGREVIDWAEEKLNSDIDGDGKIGDAK